MKFFILLLSSLPLSSNACVLNENNYASFSDPNASMTIADIMTVFQYTKGLLTNFSTLTERIEQCADVNNDNIIDNADILILMETLFVNNPPQIPLSSPSAELLESIPFYPVPPPLSPTPVPPSSHESPRVEQPTSCSLHPADLRSPLAGFVNPNFPLTMLDAILVYYYGTGRLTRDVFARLQQCGDFNHDGVINIVDAQKLMLYVTSTI